MFRRPQPVRPDPLRLARLRKRSELRSDLEGVEPLHEARTMKENLVYGVILLAVLLVAVVIILRVT